MFKYNAALTVKLFYNTVLTFKPSYWPVCGCFNKKFNCPACLLKAPFVLKQVDDILGEESDNESEGRGKDKVGPEEAEEEEEERQQEQEQQQHPGAGQISREGLSPQAPALEERIQTPSSEAPSSSCLPR